MSKVLEKQSDFDIADIIMRYISCYVISCHGMILYFEVMEFQACFKHSLVGRSICSKVDNVHSCRTHNNQICLFECHLRRSFDLIAHHHHSSLHLLAPH